MILGAQDIEAAKKAIRDRSNQVGVVIAVTNVVTVLMRLCPK